MHSETGRDKKEEGGKKSFYIPGWNVEVIVMPFMGMKENLVLEFN